MTILLLQTFAATQLTLYGHFVLARVRMREHFHVDLYLADRAVFSDRLICVAFDAAKFEPFEKFDEVKV